MPWRLERLRAREPVPQGQPVHDEEEAESPRYPNPHRRSLILHLRGMVRCDLEEQAVPPHAGSVSDSGRAEKVAHAGEMRSKSS